MNLTHFEDDNWFVKIGAVNFRLLNPQFKLREELFATKYSKMDQVKFVEDSL